jgi:hypothetical protein
VTATLGHPRGTKLRRKIDFMVLLAVLIFMDMSSLCYVGLDDAWQLWLVWGRSHFETASVRLRALPLALAFLVVVLPLRSEQSICRR